MFCRQAASVPVGECATSGLRLVLAPSLTPAHAASQKLLTAIEFPKDGDVVEFSPASSGLAFEIGTAVGKRGGGALDHLI